MVHWKRGQRSSDGNAHAAAASGRRSMSRIERLRSAEERPLGKLLSEINDTTTVFFGHEPRMAVVAA